jgi:hypothetical protein
MNGYSKVFNVEANPREEHNIASQYAWGIGPLLQAVEADKARLTQPPNPPAANLTRFCQLYPLELGRAMHPRRHVDTPDGGGVFPVWDTTDASGAGRRDALHCQRRQP